MNVSSHFDIKKYGPGMWYSIHQDAKISDKDSTRNQFINNLKSKFELFPCDKCKEHITQYMKDYPLEKSENLFYWTWKFHNDVNKRLGKQEFSYEVIYNVHFGNDKCESCSVTENLSSISKIIPFTFESRSDVIIPNVSINKTIIKRRKK